MRATHDALSDPLQTNLKHTHCSLTSVKAKKALVAQNLLKTIETVFVHQLSYHRASGALVLHASLYQVNRIHSGSSHS